MNVDINDRDRKDDNDNDNDEYIIITADRTGIKITNRGQWMEKKWKNCSKERLSPDPYAINIKTKEILDLKVTDETPHDGKRMNETV